MQKIPRYVADLLASKSDADRCCFISDGAQAGATVLYRDRWLVIQHDRRHEVVSSQEIALVTLAETADPEKMSAAALALDFEGDPLWLIDATDLDELGGYGSALKVLWRSDRTA